jgi:uncharacterized protein (TIGR00251 family)
MALIIDIKVAPLSGRSAWKLDKNGQLKCYLKSAPEKGQANSELMRLVAQALRIPQTDIQIVAGATQRLKKLKIAADISREQLLKTLGIFVPESTQQSAKQAETLAQQLGIFDKKKRE